MSYSEASTSAVLVENEDNDSAVEPRFQGDKKGKSQVTEIIKESLPATGAPRTNAPQGDDSAAVLAFGEAEVTHLIDEWISDDYVDNNRDGSSANPQLSRKRPTGLSVHVHPRNRTLSESVQAYLSRPAVPRPPTKKPSVSWDEQPRRTSDAGRPTTNTLPSLLLRLTDGPTDPDIDRLPRKTSVGRITNSDRSTPNDIASEQQHPGCRSQSYVFLSDLCSSGVAKHTDATIRRSDGATRSRRLLPSTDHEVIGTFSAADPSPGREEFPSVPGVTQSTRNGHDMPLSQALVLEMDGRPASRHGESIGPGHRIQMGMRGARGTGDRSGPGDSELANDDNLDLRVEIPGRWTLLGGDAALASLDNHDLKHAHGYGGTNKDTCPSVEVSTGTNEGGPLFLHGDERAACEAVGGVLGDDASKNVSASGSVSTLTSVDADALELEMRLRARARLRMRLAAIKGTGGAGCMGPISESSPGMR